MPKKANNLAPANVPERVGEWLLQEQVGGGAFGTVWRAQHHVWADQQAAVKLPHDPEYVRALRREGVYAHKLSHPNVVRALGFDPFAEVPYLVMEYVPGLDLRRHLAKNGPMRPADAAAVLRQVLAGLAYAHGQGVVHLDVKPENVLLHEAALSGRLEHAGEGTVKVTDFGLGKAENLMAKQHGGGGDSIVFSTDLSTPQGQQIAGTLDYMAPEQRRPGATVDARADLYACGVLLFEMLTGERPAGTDLPSDINKAVPPHLDDAFRRGYARLERRFESAEQFIGALALPGRVAKPKAEWSPRAVGTVEPVEPVDAEAAEQQAQQLRAAAGCPSCQGSVDAGDQFCMHCGTQLVQRVRRCGQCGAFPSPDDNFCMFCGHNLRPKGAQGAGTDVRA